MVKKLETAGVIAFLLYITGASPLYADSIESAANEFFTRSVTNYATASAISDADKLRRTDQLIEDLGRLIKEHPGSSLAVQLVTTGAVGAISLPALTTEAEEFRRRIAYIGSAQQQEDRKQVALQKLEQTKRFVIQGRLAEAKDLAVTIDIPEIQDQAVDASLMAILKVYLSQDRLDDAMVQVRSVPARQPKWSGVRRIVEYHLARKEFQAAKALLPMLPESAAQFLSRQIDAVQQRS